MDTVAPYRRSENMRRIKGKHTTPERLVRSLLHRSGFRYRLHRADLPGCPDIVFAKKSKVIFVHGCFWHMHAGCGGGRMPRSRLDYWKPKLLGNVKRDTLVRTQLRQMGWSVLIVWECQLDRPGPLLKKLKDFLTE